MVCTGGDYGRPCAHRGGVAARCELDPNGMLDAGQLEPRLCDQPPGARPQVCKDGTPGIVKAHCPKEAARTLAAHLAVCGRALVHRGPRAAFGLRKEVHIRLLVVLNRAVEATPVRIQNVIGHCHGRWVNLVESRHDCQQPLGLNAIRLVDQITQHRNELLVQLVEVSSKGRCRANRLGFRENHLELPIECGGAALNRPTT